MSDNGKSLDQPRKSGKLRISLKKFKIKRKWKSKKKKRKRINTSPIHIKYHSDGYSSEELNSSRATTPSHNRLLPSSANARLQLKNTHTHKNTIEQKHK